MYLGKNQNNCKTNKLFSADKENCENADLKKGIWGEILKMQNKLFEEDLLIRQTPPIQSNTILTKNSYSQFNSIYNDFFSIYSVRRLIGPRIIKAAVYCNHILLVLLYINSTQSTSVNWIIWLALLLLCRPKVILLSGGHCINSHCSYSDLHLLG